MTNKHLARERRHNRFLQKKRAVSDRPRVIVFRSNTQIYAQLIDDSNGNVITGVSSLEMKQKKPMEKAEMVGKEMAKKLKERNIEAIAFDKNGFAYHGKVKTLAEAMRQEGIIF